MADAPRGAAGRRGVLVGVALLALHVLVGCDEDVASTECTPQVRVGERLFSAHGYTRAEATRHGTAERAECHDVGEDAAGSAFPGAPRQVRTWAFDGHSTDQVLGARAGRAGTAVFVAESVPREERDRVLAELDDAAP